MSICFAWLFVNTSTCMIFLLWIMINGFVHWFTCFFPLLLWICLCTIVNMGKLLNYVDGTHINYILSMSSSVLKTFVNGLFYESFDIIFILNIKICEF